MRSIINVSVPPDLNRIVGRLAKKGNYATKSEFLRELIRERIAEEDVLAQVRESEKEFREGRGKILRSLKDLR